MCDDDQLFHNMDYDLFLRCLAEEKEGIDETEILFLDDLERGECILGYIREIEINGEIRYFDEPYWIGTGCDVKDGKGFVSAEDLLHAKAYGGRSIHEAWKKVHVLHLGRIPLDYFFESCCTFGADVFEENGVWKLRSES